MIDLTILNMNFNTNLHRGILITVGSFGVASIYSAPHTILLEKVKETLHLYRCAKATPLPPEVIDLSRVVMNEMKLPEEKQQNIEFFAMSGFGFFHGGSVWIHDIFGKMKKAIIGIPPNFHAETWKDQKINMHVNGNQVKWSSEEGKELDNALILSEKAKKFSIAQRIYYVSSPEVPSKIFLTGLIFYLSFLYFYCLQNLFEKKGVKKRWPAYILLFGTKFTLWFLLKDALSCYFENKADKTLADMGQDYVEGGLDFYESILHTNIILHNLAEKNGQKSRYTKFGNKQTFIRTKHIPLTARRDFFKDHIN